MPVSDSNRLCLKCGLCCNGVIFADVELEPEDNVKDLEALGLAIHNQKSKIKNPKFFQPCSMLEGCRCRIYADRPKYCREFECVLLKSVRRGTLDESGALRLIRRARAGCDEVKKFLRALGDEDEGVALSARFRRMQRRMQLGGADGQRAELFGRLTLAMQDLNVLLSRSFYPGPRRDANCANNHESGKRNITADGHGSTRIQK